MVPEISVCSVRNGRELDGAARCRRPRETRHIKFQADWGRAELKHQENKAGRGTRLRKTDLEIQACALESFGVPTAFLRGNI